MAKEDKGLASVVGGVTVEVAEVVRTEKWVEQLEAMEENKVRAEKEVVEEQVEAEAVTKAMSDVTVKAVSWAEATAVADVKEKGPQAVEENRAKAETEVLEEQEEVWEGTEGTEGAEVAPVEKEETGVEDWAKAVRTGMDTRGTVGVMADKLAERVEIMAETGKMVAEIEERDDQGAGVATEGTAGTEVDAGATGWAEAVVMAVETRVTVVDAAGRVAETGNGVAEVWERGNKEAEVVSEGTDGTEGTEAAARATEVA